MSKYDSLLKKVEAFEKMAVYSRSAFLKSLSEDNIAKSSDETSNEFDLTDILESGQKSSSLK